MSIRCIKTPDEMRAAVREIRQTGRTVGFVPTMGYLHEGHASLIRLAGQYTDTVAVSVFVNPTQFAAGEDFQRYPRNIERDKQIAEAAGASLMFLPEVEDMYPAGFASTVSVGDVSTRFEGAHRPDHFNGVATVVSKLLLITEPHSAFFGRKDYQQCLVIQRLVHDLNIPVRIIIGPTVRENDGLAMSSRNAYLTEIERQEALCLYKALTAACDIVRNGERKRDAIEQCLRTVLSATAGLRIDYASAARAATLEQPDSFIPGETIVLLLAVRLGSTRLIDNMLVELP